MKEFKQLDYFSNKLKLAKTSEDVEGIVSEFQTTLHNYFGNFWSGYSFEHIVIDDYNFFDSDIAFCLDPVRITEWKNRILTELAPETWEEAVLNDVKMYKFIYYTVWFLSQLLLVPEEVRLNEAD